MYPWRPKPQHLDLHAVVNWLPPVETVVFRAVAVGTEVARGNTFSQASSDLLLLPIRLDLSPTSIPHFEKCLSDLTDTQYYFQEGTCGREVADSRAYGRSEERQGHAQIDGEHRKTDGQHPVRQPV